MGKGSVNSFGVVRHRKCTLQHPGGPYNKIPLDGFKLSFLNCSGYFKGHSTAFLSCNLTLSKPPMSSHFTLGISLVIDRLFDGEITAIAFVKSSRLISTSSMCLADAFNKASLHNANQFH